MMQRENTGMNENTKLKQQKEPVTRKKYIARTHKYDEKTHSPTQLMHT